MLTNSVLLLTRFDVADEEKKEIIFVNGSVIGRNRLSPGSLKLPRKIAVVEHSGDEDNPNILTLTCTSKRPIFQQSLNKNNENSVVPNNCLELPFAKAYRSGSDECTFQLNNGDLLSFLPKSFVYAVNVRELNLEQMQELRRDELTSVEDEDTDYDDLSEEGEQQHEPKLEIAESSREVNGSQETVTESKRNPPEADHVDTAAEKVTVRKRILPAWMLSEGVEVPNKSIDKKSRGRTGGRQTKPATRTRPIKEHEEMEALDSDRLQDDDDEEDELVVPKRPAKPSRQRRAAAARVCSYAENDFVASDSDFSQSDEEYGTADKSGKRRKKHESDEEYEDEQNVVNDSGSDLDTWSGSQRRRSSSSRHHRKTTTGRARPSSSKKHKAARRSSRQKRSMDDEFIDDDEEEEEDYIKPKSSKFNAPNRFACTYGNNCYRKNPAHKKDFSHPGDDDWPEVGDEQNDDEEGGSSSSPINSKTKVFAKRKFELANEDSASSEQSFASGASDDADDADYGITKRKSVSGKKSGKRRKR